MIERDMEDLIAAYPKDFFPRKDMVLKGRQQSFAGVGRFDILFEDEHQTQILLELKARVAKYEDASQLAKYKEALMAQGVKNILMWLVATQIPGQVREFLDRIGIEYTEIHESEYREVAARHGISIASEQPSQASPMELESDDSFSVHAEDELGQPHRTQLSKKKRHVFRNKITPEFRMNRDRLKIPYSVAYNFLRYPETHLDSGMWLSTATNAHVYMQDGFLAYIIIDPGFITLTPKIHGRIHAATVDRSSLLFTPSLRKIIEKHGGVQAGWATYNGDGSIKLRKDTPALFFKDLISLIESLA